LTLSLLRGEYGGQAGDLQALCAWLAGHPRPDIVHLSNALLLGLARKIGQTLKAPVVCSLQDEDSWVDAMPMPLAKRIWAEIRTRVPDVAGFLAASHYAAARMPRRMGMPLRNLRVVHPGLELPPALAAPERLAAPVWGVLLDPDDTRSLVRVCAAYQALRRRPDCATLRLRLAGPTPTAGMFSDIAARNFSGDIEFVPRGVRRAALPGFLRGLSVLTLLPREEPAFALDLLDAMARGVAVVQPAAGANPEILELAEGGVLFDPASPDALAQAVAGLVSDPARQAFFARRGRHGVELQFSLARMARVTVDVYQAVCEGRRRSEAR
jgi:glycosyltransferase involved in cell wall biosynthesis